MNSRHKRHQHSYPLTHQEGVKLKPGNRGSDRRVDGALLEIEEEVRRLQQLVCELLITNQELRFQFAQSDSGL